MGLSTGPSVTLTPGAASLNMFTAQLIFSLLGFTLIAQVVTIQPGDVDGHLGPGVVFQHLQSLGAVSMSGPYNGGPYHRDDPGCYSVCRQKFPDTEMFDFSWDDKHSFNLCTCKKAKPGVRPPPQCPGTSTASAATT